MPDERARTIIAGVYTSGLEGLKARLEQH